MFKSTICLCLIMNLGSIAAIENLKAHTQDDRTNDRVQLRVFYETLCPASVTFFTSQLGPAVEKFAKHMDVQLIPYGHATTWNYRGRHAFNCQHGPAECYGNQLHACVIEVLRNNSQAALFNACLMQNTIRKPDVGYDFSYALNWCGYVMNVDVQDIRRCTNSSRGAELLESHGVETKKLKPRYVPYLELNGFPDQHGRAANDLKAMVCQMVWPTPAKCY